MFLPFFRFVPISEIEATLADEPWPYAEAHSAAIAADWAAWTAENPSLFNGTVLLVQSHAIAGGVVTARYLPVRFAAFLHYMREGTPDGTTRNGFALAGLVGSDGVLVMGVMGAHTANAGKIYFPGGTPDLGDVVDGRVDLAGSVARELEEETGLTPAELSFDPGFWLYEDEKRLAFVKIVRSPLTGAALRDTIRARLSRQAEPELADLHLVGSPADLVPERMPAFQLAFAEWWLAGGRQEVERQISPDSRGGA